MKFKALKSKIMAAVLAVGIMGGAGATFAATNAGTQLRTWYSSQFATAKAGSYSELSTYIQSKEDGIRKEGNKIEGDANFKVLIKGLEEEIRTDNSIKDHAKEYMEQIKAESEMIKSDVQDDFDAAVASRNEEVNTNLDKEAQQLQEKINERVTKTVDSAVYRIGGATIIANNAAKELRAVIAEAKGEINVEINTEKSIATQELKGNFDTKIGELRTQINAETNSLVEEGMSKITDRGIEMEAKGKEIVDKVLNEI